MKKVGGNKQIEIIDVKPVIERINAVEVNDRTIVGWHRSQITQLKSSDDSLAIAHPM